LAEAPGVGAGGAPERMKLKILGNVSEPTGGDTRGTVGEEEKSAADENLGNG